MNFYYSKTAVFAQNLFEMTFHKFIPNKEGTNLDFLVLELLFLHKICRLSSNLSTKMSANLRLYLILRDFGALTLTNENLSGALARALGADHKSIPHVPFLG